MKRADSEITVPSITAASGSILLRPKLNCSSALFSAVFSAK